MLVAEYNRRKYRAIIQNSNVILVSKCAEDGFSEKRGLYQKEILLNDTGLQALYEIHFYVKYHDISEPKTEWLVDEGRPVGIADIERGEVIIDVQHDSKNESWKQIDKCAAAKLIKLNDCFGYIIEKNYKKPQQQLEHREIDRDSFHDAMMEIHSIR